MDYKEAVKEEEEATHRQNVQLPCNYQRIGYYYLLIHI